MGGNPGDVLCPSVGLDIGPISGPDVEKARFDLLTAWLGGDFPLPDCDPDDYAQRDMLWEQRQRDRERLLEGGKHGEAVRIWYSNAPYSLCGFYDVLWQLRDCDCPVTALEMPRWMPLEDNTVQSCLNWGELSPGDWAAYLPLEREIPENVRRAIAMEWSQLREENAPLRAVVNGRLHSVGEDFYDPFIRAHIHDRSFRVGQLIGEVLGRYQLGIGDWWIAKRIQAMADHGELIIVSKVTASTEMKFAELDKENQNLLEKWGCFMRPQAYLSPTPRPAKGSRQAAVCRTTSREFHPNCRSDRAAPIV